MCAKCCYVPEKWIMCPLLRENSWIANTCSTLCILFAIFRNSFNSSILQNWLLPNHQKKVTGCLCILRIIDNAIAFSHTNCETTAQIRASLSLTLCSFLNIFVRPFFVPLLALSLVFRSNRLFSTSSFELLSHLLFLLYLL